MRTLYSFLALCAAITLAVPAQAQSLRPLVPEIDAAYEALADKADRAGSVRVIVNLDVRFIPEGNLSASAVQAQRSALASAQASVLGALASPEGVRQFRFTPALAATVGPDDLARLRSHPQVAWLQEDVPVEAHDPGPVSPLSFVSPRLDESTVLVGATAAHAAGFDGTGYEVAILDTGVDSDHPFLDGQVVAEGCFSTTSSESASTTVCPNGQEEQTGPGSGAECDSATFSSDCDHGTHVAGIAAGNQTGATGPLVGVAPGAGIVAVQVFSGFTSAQPACGGTACALSYTSDQILGLEYVYDLVVNEERNIVSANMSLGGGQYTSTCDADSRKDIIDNLLSVGVSTTISSGNSGYQNATGAPGCISTAVTVGSTTKADGVSSFSNIAPWMDLFAPGSSIQSSIPGTGYAFYNGTSMSAPHVAGAFAVLQDRFPAASPAVLLQRLKTAGAPIPAGSPSAIYPRIQIDAAFNDPPEFDYSPGEITMSLGLDEEGSETLTLSNTAAPGSVALAWSASLENVLDETGQPVSNACGPNQSLTQAAASFFTYSDSGSDEYGQSFVVTCTGQMTTIAPDIYGPGAPGESWSGTLRVYAGEGTGGTELASVDVSYTNPNARLFLPIVLDEPISVQVGETYTWFLDLDSNRAPLLYSTQNPLAGGQEYRTLDGTPGGAAAISSNDMTFRVDFAPPTLWPSVVPMSGTIEPGSSEDVTVAFDATGYPVGTYTGDLVITTNDEDEGEVTIPLTMIVQEEATGVSIVIDGPRGYRFLGPPALGVTVDDLADQNLVRGVPGYYPGAPANIWTEYDATDNEWIPSEGTGEVLELGKAFRWLLFNREFGNPTISQSVELPFTLSTEELPNTADVTVELQSDGTRFNYLANPFGETLDLTGIASWPGGGNVNTNVPVMTYDPLLRSWDDAPATIEPWMGFRIRSKGPRRAGNDNPRTLTIPASEAGGPAPSVTSAREAAPQLAFELSGRDLDGRPLADRAFTVAFADAARATFDVDQDVQKLRPLAETYAVVGARAGDRLVGYDARPFAAGEIPLAVEARGAARALTLSWDASALPAGLPVVLVDLQTGAEIDVRTRSSVTFEVASQPALAEAEMIAAGEYVDGADAADRFVLRIGAVLADADAVDAVALTAIAPNPTAGLARLSFAVPEAGVARVSVVDVRGREVAVLVDGPVAAGRHEATLDASGLAAGVYVIRLEAGGEVVTRQAAVVR